LERLGGEGEREIKKNVRGACVIHFPNGRYELHILIVRQ
jgi:hypothetical protein